MGRVIYTPLGLMGRVNCTIEQNGRLQSKLVLIIVGLGVTVRLTCTCFEVGKVGRLLSR